MVHQPGLTPITINSDQANTIHLWLAGRHYQIYDSVTHSAVPVPADGNCLFHAILEAMGTKSTPEEIAKLRKLIAEYLEEYAGNSIHNMYSAIFTAHNPGQLAEAIAFLPPGDLLDEAIELLPHAQHEVATGLNKFGSDYLEIFQPSLFSRFGSFFSQ